MIGLLIALLSMQPTTVTVVECSAAVAPVRAASVCTVVAKGARYVVRDLDVVDGAVASDRLTCRYKSSLQGEPMVSLPDGLTWRAACAFLTRSFP